MSRLILLALLLVMGLMVGCMPSQVFPATPTKTPEPFTPQVEPSPVSTRLDVTEEIISTPDPTTLTPVTETLEPTDSSTEPAVVGTPTITSIPPTHDPSLPPEHYLFLRPIPSGWTDYSDRTYAYGSTSGGAYRPHTGQEFRNPPTTPVIAVGNGTVYYTGTDQDILYGPQPNFYGNLIVLQMDGATPSGQSIFVLYGHLDELYVQTGQTVAAGDIVGTVGSTGVALGPHLHFEIRVGDPLSYFTSTRNPDLWLKPYYGYGTLAGRVVDGSGIPLREVALTVHGSDMKRYTWTYAGDENIPDEQWKENFTLGDLPQGWYTVTTRSASRTYSVEIYIESGHTTWLELVFD